MLFFDGYRELFANTESPRSIVELGVFEGGSALILAEMFPHARIEAVDLRAANPAVLRHITRMGFADRLRIPYGVLTQPPEIRPGLCRVLTQEDARCARAVSVSSRSSG